MADIFISHVEEDASVALDLAQALEHSGFSVWYYERDTVIGPSYLVQIGEAIDGCHAVILLISSHSLSSFQVRQEVIRAYESQKPFLPLLIDVSHAEFQTRQPEWRAALGAAASLRIPPAGIRAILPQLTQGLATLRIHPRRPCDAASRREEDSSHEEVRPPVQPRGATAAPSSESRLSGREDAPLPAEPSRRLKNALLAVILVLVMGIIGYWGYHLPSSPSPLTRVEEGKDSATSVDNLPGPDVANSKSEAAQGSSLIVSGKGKELYYVYDASGQKQLKYTFTGRITELFPGTYQVELNKTRKSVTVQANRRTIVEAGSLIMSGEGKELYYVYDASGQKQLKYTFTGQITELFPGTYQVELNRNRVTVHIRANEITTL